MIDSSSRIEQLRRQLKVALPGWNDIDPLCDFALRGREAQWVSVEERLPTERGWYGVLDADNEPRAGLFVNDQWAANAVMPIRAWCNFPPLPPAPEEES